MNIYHQYYALDEYPFRRHLHVMQTISLTELRSLVQTENPVLFEALPQSYFAAGHLPGAFAMPLDAVAEVAHRVAPDKTRPVVVYCASLTCQNSHVAAEKLTRLGYQAVRIFSGGKAEWKEAGLPLEVSP